MGQHESRGRREFSQAYNSNSRSRSFDASGTLRGVGLTRVRVSKKFVFTLIEASTRSRAAWQFVHRAPNQSHNDKEELVEKYWRGDLLYRS